MSLKPIKYKELEKSKGILDDFPISKALYTREGTIEKVPVNSSDIVNKAYCDANGVTDHGDLTGLSDDDHSQYALLAGRSGGQTLVGGTGSGDDLILQSTSHGTKGEVIISGGSHLHVVQGANNNFLKVTGTGIAAGSPTDNNAGVGLYLGFNSSGNRQALMGNSDNVGNPNASLFRYLTGSGIANVDGISGDGNTRLPVCIGTDTSDVAVGGSGLAYNATLRGKLDIYTQASKVGLVVGGATSQSANLIEAKNVSNTTLFSVAADGDTSMVDLTSTGISYQNHAASQPSRSINTTYQNTTGHPIIVYGSVSGVAEADAPFNGYISCITDSASSPTTVVQKSGITGLDSSFTDHAPFYMVVQNNHYYKVTSTTITGVPSFILDHWNEVNF